MDKIQIRQKNNVKKIIIVYSLSSFFFIWNTILYFCMTGLTFLRKHVKSLYNSLPYRFIKKNFFYLCVAKDTGHSFGQNKLIQIILRIKDNQKSYLSPLLGIYTQINTLIN